MWPQLNTDLICISRSWLAASFIQPLLKMASDVWVGGCRVCLRSYSQLTSEGVCLSWASSLGRPFLADYKSEILLCCCRCKDTGTDFAGRERSEGNWWALQLCLIRTKFLSMGKKEIEPIFPLVSLSCACFFFS